VGCEKYWIDLATPGVSVKQIDLSTFAPGAWVMITELSENQKLMLKKYKEDFFKLGSSTEPADKNTAEKAIKEVYKMIGEGEPQFVWCDSPMSALLTMEFLSFIKTKMEEPPLDKEIKVSMDNKALNAETDCFTHVVKGVDLTARGVLLSKLFSPSDLSMINLRQILHTQLTTIDGPQLKNIMNYFYNKGISSAIPGLEGRLSFSVHNALFTILLFPLSKLSHDVANALRGTSFIHTIDIPEITEEPNLPLSKKLSHDLWAAATFVTPVVSPVIQLLEQAIRQSLQSPDAPLDLPIHSARADLFSNLNRALSHNLPMISWPFAFASSTVGVRSIRAHVGGSLKFLDDILNMSLHQPITKIINEALTTDELESAQTKISHVIGHPIEHHIHEIFRVNLRQDIREPLHTLLNGALEHPLRSLIPNPLNRDLWANANKQIHLLVDSYLVLHTLSELWATTPIELLFNKASLQNLLQRPLKHIIPFPLDFTTALHAHSTIKSQIDNACRIHIYNELWDKLSNEDIRDREHLTLLLHQALRDFDTKNNMVFAKVAEQFEGVNKILLDLDVRTSPMHPPMENLRRSLADSRYSPTVRSVLKQFISSIKNVRDFSVQDTIRKKIMNELANHINYSIYQGIVLSVYTAVETELINQKYAALRDSFLQHITNAVENTLSKHLDNYFYGSQNAPWLAYYLYCRDVLGISYDEQYNNIINLWYDISKSCFWWFPYKGICIVCNKPEICKFEPNGESPRVHSERGPAIGFRDGWSIYSWHGILVDKHIIDQPETITVEEIEKEENAEVRRIQVERYGLSKYIKDSGSSEISRDIYGRLWRKELKGDEAIVMLEVLNASPEPDGSYKTYFLRVPPIMTSPKEAVAWTFDIPVNEYNPEVET
jgi:hypothetical protein